MKSEAKSLPVIALVGRPNVGKSTLFNHLTHSRQALVAAVSGLTRDRKEAEVRYERYHFRLVDTGGMPFADGEPLSAAVTGQIQAALNAADVILFLVDGADGLNPYDVELYRLLERQNVPLFVLVNKLEHPKHDPALAAFYALGTDRLMGVSALHGRGVGDVLAAVDALVPIEAAADADEAPKPIRVTFLGRPNVGKSSLVNAILADERMIVSDIPGTTREAVDIDLLRDGRAYRLIDTAGVRRRARTKEYVEKIGVLSSLEAIRRADVVVMVVDAAGEVAEQDARLAGYIHTAGRAAVVAMNKWDLLGGKKRREQDAQTRVSERLAFLDFAPLVRTSAVAGTGLGQLFKAINGAFEQYTRRIQTADLNRVIEMSMVRHTPPAKGRSQTKLYYGLQVRASPPRFRFYTNHPEAITPAYTRYLEHQLRHHFGLQGTPLVLTFEARGGGRRGRPPAG